MNKNKFMVCVSLLIFLVVINGCGELSIPKSEEEISIQEEVPTSPLKVELSISKAPALGETVELTASIWYTVRINDKLKANMPETVANITLPDGFELISGNTAWKGYIQNQPQKFSVQTKAVKIGNWTIGAKIRNLGRQGGGFDYVYVSVLEDGGIISEGPFPLPYREGSDRTVDLNDSEIPALIAIPDINITTPKRTEEGDENE